MSTKPFRMTGGFVFGAVLAILGFLVQVAAGPVNWDRVAFPVNLILLVALVAFLAVALSLRRKVRLFAWMGSLEAAVPAIAWTLIFMIALGLIAQGPGRGWLGSMTTFWPFVLTYSWLVIVTGLMALGRLAGLCRSWRWKALPSLLIHLGFFLTLVFSALGSADRKTLEMTVREGESETVAVGEDGMSVDTGLSVRLEDFVMETYPNGMPKKFASDVEVTGRSGSPVRAVIEVNKPIKVDGWNIYQYDYDSEAGTESRISVFQLVRNPWLPLVYSGIFILLAGALLLLFAGFGVKGAYSDSDDASGKEVDGLVTSGREEEGGGLILSEREEKGDGPAVMEVSSVSEVDGADSEGPDVESIDSKGRDLK